MYEIKEDSPEGELRRADHLIYVSLKYTRTCDVIKNAIKRLLSAFDLMFVDYLEKMKYEKKIEEVPSTRKERSDMFKGFLGNSVKKYMALYKL